MDEQKISLNKNNSYKSLQSVNRKIQSYKERLSRNDLSLRIKKEIRRTSKKTLDNGNYFLKKILKMKKEINKNEFSRDSEEIMVNNKNENLMMKKIETNLKNSLIHLKYESGFDSTRSLKKNKIKNSNVKSLSDFSPKKEKKMNEHKINVCNSLGSDSDFSLLNNESNSKIALKLNNEETKYTIQNAINNNNNKNEKTNGQIKVKKTNKSFKSNMSNTTRLRNEKFRKLMNKGIVYDSFDDEEEFEDQINKDFYILPNSIFIIILDFLVATNVFYYLALNPYLIASSTKFIYSKFFTYIDIYHLLNELISIIDFLIHFVRAYYDFDENLVTNKKKIIINYLGSWFLVDLITVIPTFLLIKIFYEKDKYIMRDDYICNYGCQSDNLIYLISFIKVIKVFNILDRNQNQFISFILSRLSNTTFMDNWGNIIFEVILAIIFLHMTACINIIVGRNSYPNWIINNNLSANNFSTIYLTSIYFVITTLTSVGYGDITGNGMKEYIFQIFLLIVGIMAYSWLVSSVSNYVRENNKDNEYFQSKVNILDDIKLTHPEMDNELYKKIYLYLKQLKIVQKRKGKNSLLDSLPYNLKNLILYEIHRPIIEGINFFKNFHNSIFILSAVTKLIPIVTNKGDVIIEQNEIINSMFFVKQGRLGVELAVDMNNIYNEIDDYLNGNFILGENKEKKDQYLRKNTFSLMTTFNYTMDDSFILSQARKLDLNYKKPLSFRKRLLKFMKPKLMTPCTNENQITLNQNNIKYVKLYYIRKGEHFGDIFMFLNKPSCFTLKVKSPKAELLLLKKIDAIEISSNYPNIWKRTNKKSFRNLINLKELVSREMIKFCRKNGIKYKNTNKEVKHSISLPNLEKLKKNKNNHKNDDLRVRFKKFKKSSLIGYNNQRLEKLSSINCNLNQTAINTSI